MIVKQFLNLIKPTINIKIYDIDNHNLLQEGYLAELEYNCKYLNNNVLSIEPENGNLKIEIDLNNIELDDELSNRDLEIIEDLLMENIENNKEQLYNINDEFRSFYERKNQKFKKLAQKIDYILEEFYE